MSWLRSLSIRARITLGSVVVALVAVSGAAVAMHQQIERIVHESEVTLAEGDLSPYEADLHAHPDEAPDSPAAGILVLVRAPDGSVPVDTTPHDIREVIHRYPRGLPDGVTTVLTDEDVRFTLVSRTVNTSAGAWEVWAARSGASGDLTMRALDGALLIGAAVLIGVFGVAAWLLTTAALRPVARMRRTAETLSTDATGQLLPVGPAHDELAALAETLNDFIARMRATAAREREMVSAASHELRTPIAAMTTQLELAHRSFGDAEALETEIRAAEGSLDRLSRLAANLLELSRLDAASPAEQSASVTALESEVMEAVDRGRLVAGVSGPQIEFDLELPHPTASVALSATAFSRILDNLVANAVAATPSTGLIRLSLRQDEAGLVLDVSDTGRGMPDDFVPHAFDRFSRPDEARDVRSGGSGLGLALVAALAHNAGGQATIGNRPNGGVLVSVTLPEEPVGTNM
ncbi:sensor histidine kinase [Plantibacter sp. YIM 135347]|uniref:sensor histidine kinase n=1 Tax=Plantibacter sp. YIM 135347 TaxID=3423919 RepID=UPI003D346589